MKLAAILTETKNLDKTQFATFTEEITLEQAATLVKTHCRQNAARPLFRGMGGSSVQAIATDSSQIQRTSRDNPNYYTMLLSGGLNSWSRYPPRNRATICSATKELARQYGHGDFHYVFPEDGLRFAIAPTGDIWTSFDNMMSLFTSDNPKLPDAPDDMTDFMLRIKSRGASMGAADFNAALDLPMSKLFQLKVAATGTVRSFLERYMSPEFNGFGLVPSTAQLPSITGRDREVWFSGKSVAVFHDNIDEFYKIVNQ